MAWPNAIPMLADVNTSRPPIENGALSAFWIRNAIAFACWPSPIASLLPWAALLVALLTVAGSLALSLVEKKKACALCFYERTLALSLVAVLTSGLLTRAFRAGPWSNTAFPA